MADKLKVAHASMVTACITWVASAEYLKPKAMDEEEHQLVALPIPPSVMEFCNGIGEVLDDNPQRFLTALCMQLISTGLGHYLKDIMDEHGSLTEIRKMVIDSLL